MKLVDAIPLLLSGGSLVVAITGLVLTYRRSGQAIRESQKAAASALWFGVQQAVQQFIGFDPATEPVGDRQVMEAAQPGDSVDERLANLDPYQRWAQVLSQNLRYFRAVGFDADKAQELQASAGSQARAIYEKHGWELPPATIPGVKTLG